MTTVEQIYEELHEPEELGLTKVLTRSSTLFTIYLLDSFVHSEGIYASPTLKTEFVTSQVRQ